mgnify:CR=1 FL=1
MDEMIENKVEKSGLISLDLNDLAPKGQRSIIDVKDFLYEGVMIREKHFRELVAKTDWSEFDGHFVGITCSVDAIIPLWVYMVLASSLQKHVKLIIRGNKTHLEGALLKRSIENLDLDTYVGKRVIVKGCGGEIPESSYIAITYVLQPIVKSLMFGEACSTVPVFKS